MLAIVIGLIYGAAWYALHMLLSKYVASKTNNLFLIGLAPMLVTCPALVSVILIKPLVENWQVFVRVWAISFLVGAVIFKFGVYRKYYR